MVIDAHTHRYPEAIFSAPAAWAKQRHESHWANLVECSGGRSLQGFSSGSDMLEDMDAAGIDCSVLLGWYWQNQSTCDWHNAWMASWIKEHPGRLTAFASVNPAAGQTAYNAVRRAIEVDGFRGIGEMLPAVQGFSRDNDTWLNILAWAETCEVPINFHVTEPIGPDYPGNIPTPFNDFLYYAENFPRLKIILAHWGGGIPFYRLRRHTHGFFDNLYFDTAASPLLYEPEYIPLCVQAAGAHRVLFGTDYPLRIFPRRTPGKGAAEFLQQIRQAGLEGKDLDNILGRNAAQLLKF